MIWLGSCVGSISSPFFYKPSQAPSFSLGIGSLLVANCIQLALLFIFRYSFIWENKKKEKQRAAWTESGRMEDKNETAFQNLTDKENPNFVYVY